MKKEKTAAEKFLNFKKKVEETTQITLESTQEINQFFGQKNF